MSNYLATHVHENLTWNEWNSNDYDYEGHYGTGPQKQTYWYIIAKPADGTSTSQVFLSYKLTYYSELSERNQEVDYS
jgi:hypothetical protein